MSPNRERSHISEIKVAWEDDFPMDMLVSRRVVYLPTFIPQHRGFDGETTSQENTRVSFFFGGGELVDLGEFVGFEFFLIEKQIAKRSGRLGRFFCKMNRALLETDISPTKALLKMIFLFPNIGICQFPEG